jgi:hypothetical protein
MSKRSLIFESVTVIRIDVHPVGEESDNTSYAWPHESHIRQPFTKSLLGQNQTPAPRMKSWLLAIVRPSSRPKLHHSPSNKPSQSTEVHLDKVVTKLLGLQGHIKPYMRSVQIKACPSGPK